MPKYIVKLKETITYSGYIEMNEEEYEKLCLGDKDTLMNRIRTASIFPERHCNEKLVYFLLSE